MPFAFSDENESQDKSSAYYHPYFLSDLSIYYLGKKMSDLPESSPYSWEFGFGLSQPNAIHDNYHYTFAKFADEKFRSKAIYQCKFRKKFKEECHGRVLLDIDKGMGILISPHSHPPGISPIGPGNHVAAKRNTQAESYHPRSSTESDREAGSRPNENRSPSIQRPAISSLNVFSNMVSDHSMDAHGPSQRALRAISRATKRVQIMEQEDMRLLTGLAEENPLTKKKEPAKKKGISRDGSPTNGDHNYAYKKRPKTRSETRRSATATGQRKSTQPNVVNTDLNTTNNDSQALAVNKVRISPPRTRARTAHAIRLQLVSSTANSAVPATIATPEKISRKSRMDNQVTLDETAAASRHSIESATSPISSCSSRSHSSQTAITHPEPTAHPVEPEPISEALPPVSSTGCSLQFDACNDCRFSLISSENTLTEAPVVRSPPCQETLPESLPDHSNRTTSRMGTRMTEQSQENAPVACSSSQQDLPTASEPNEDLSGSSFRSSEVASPSSVNYIYTKYQLKNPPVFHDDYLYYFSSLKRETLVYQCAAVSNCLGTIHVPKNGIGVKLIQKHNHDPDFDVGRVDKDVSALISSLQDSVKKSVKPIRTAYTYFRNTTPLHQRSLIPAWTALKDSLESIREKQVLDILSEATQKQLTDMLLASPLLSELIPLSPPHNFPESTNTERDQCDQIQSISNDPPLMEFSVAFSGHDPTSPPSSSVRSAISEPRSHLMDRAQSAEPQLQEEPQLDSIVTQLCDFFDKHRISSDSFPPKKHVLDCIGRVKRVLNEVEAEIRSNWDSEHEGSMESAWSPEYNLDIEDDPDHEAFIAYFAASQFTKNSLL